MRIALKYDLEVCFKELGGELALYQGSDVLNIFWQGD